MGGNKKCQVVKCMAPLIVEQDIHEELLAMSRRFHQLYTGVVELDQGKSGFRQETIAHLENDRHNPSLKLVMDITNVFGKSVEHKFEFIEEHE